MNKKGMDISLNFIILAVLALIALILVALFFTGGLSNLFEQTEDVGSTTTEQYLYYKAQCEYYCSFGDQDTYDNPGFPADLKSLGDNPQDIDNCEQMLGKDYGSCSEAE
tara:strand:+ start:700 stop:1026 length:327 start_codon:yes stop_codon:yes gene_type:complete